MRKHKKDISYAQAAIAMARLQETGEKITVDSLYSIFSGHISKKKLGEYCKQWQLRQEHPEVLSFPLSSHNSVSYAQVGNIDLEVEKRTKELEQSLALVRATLESTADGILIISNEGQLIDWNNKFIEIMNVPEETLKSRDEGGGIARLLAQIEDPEEFIQLMQNMYKDPEASGNMGNLKFRDGRIIERYSQPHRINNEIVGRVWSFRDITTSVKSQNTLQLRHQVIEASTNGIIITDAEPPYAITYVNPAFEQLTQYTFDEVKGKSCNFLQGEETQQEQIEELRHGLAHQLPVTVTLRNYRKNEELFWNELHVSPVPNTEGKITHFVGRLIDATEKIIAQQKIVYQANHDSLTSLPNRTYFLEQAEKACANAEFKKQKVAILFIDLDHFKFINDRLGHTLGDYLLLAIAQKISSLGNNINLFSRFGGDEFVLLVEDVKDMESLEATTQHILDTLNETINVKGHELNTTASIGVSIFPDHANSVADLLKNSDIAMYQAKEEGRNRYCLYDAKLRNRVHFQMTIESSLHSALKNHEFFLVYQPLINLETKKVVGAEALIRWLHPSLGLIPPVQFIPLAELNGEINHIGLWVLDISCEQYKKWLNEYGLEYIAVNISTRQLKCPQFIEDTLGILKKHQLNPAQINMELTESIFIDDSNIVADNIAKLKEIGIKLSIDDFGTGFSNFSYLKRFQIDKIKIDRSFIDKVNPDSPKYDMSIPISIINMGADLEINVLAEGVENEYQLNFLIEHNCKEGQGYHFGKPMAVEDFEALLKSGKVF